MVLQITDGAWATIGYAVVAVPIAICIAWIFIAVINNTAKQPEAHGAMRGAAMIGFAVIEALAILGFVLAFLNA
jgi:F-type H+-transporting ATPase subunit c